ncbi:MAG TPA: DNA gyrase subunit A [Candidatus Nanoarchaeia archaeon]|nr:DNA gyrase subunit A [Candidatus Nanoarchaeia archaeon]
MAEIQEQKQEREIIRVIEDEMKQSYLDYAMSVIVGRALPDVRDGLKPVHRRILFGMHELGNSSNKPFKKSARIVGEILGKFHPHGDQAVYDSLVRMVQDFSLRYPLIQGQGNFGNIDGDNAAAMRYSEARLARTSEEMLQDIDKETVDFIPNFDGTLKEPTVLPSKLPNLLINGSSGIAVGMATNIPPHNVSEICDGIIKTIENPEISFEQLFSIIKGPDFPTGASILGRQGILEYYKTGRGKIVVRAKIKTEHIRNKEIILITEIPYQVNKSQLIEEVAQLVREKSITGISDIRDESDREGIRIVLELKQGFTSEVVLNQLYKHTRLQTTFGVIMLALVNNEPKILNVRELITHFINHRRAVVRRKTEFELRKAEERKHILEGLIVALNDSDSIVQKIKKSRDVETARKMLINDYALTEIQAKAILEMRLQRFAALEQEKIKIEHSELINLILELKNILSDEKRILGIIKNELIELKQKYSDSRRTEVTQDAEMDIEIEDLIKEEEVVVTYTHSGYIKRIPLETYRQQKRGGKGITATETKEEDFVEYLFVSSTHNYIMLFTDKGRVHWLKVYTIPEASRHSLGKSIANLIEMDKDEKISAMLPVKEFDEKQFLLISTRKGIIKKTNLSEYSRPRKGGIIAATLDEGDKVVNVRLTDGSKNIILATRKGMAARFNESDARAIGRAGRGVKGITLREGDYVIGMEASTEKETLLTVTENGYGKRSLVSEYRLISRGGIGVINVKATEKNGNVVGIKTATDEDEIICISQNGIIIRIPVKQISVIGRNTQGVRIMKLAEGDKVVSVEKIARE